MDALTRQIQELRLGDSIKPQKPEPFTGERGQVRSFITQARLYFNLEKTSERKQPLMLVTLFRGAAYRWIEPRVREYLEGGDKCPTATTKMLTDVETLFTNMTEAFGDIDEEQ